MPSVPMWTISSDTFQSLLRKVIDQGGKLAEDSTCEGREVTLEPALEAKESQTVATCGCGLDARLILVYDDRTGTEQTYTACANCDRVDEQPRYL